MTKPNKEWLEKTMKSLEISEEEALELWACDHDEIENEEQNDLDKKASKVKIDHGAGGKKRVDRKPREKKVNAEKIAIIQSVFNAIQTDFSDIQSISVRNDEKYVDFTLNGVEYTLNLVAHRPKKA